MISHGRRVCQAQRPRCGVCPLRDLCDYYAAIHTAEDTEDTKI
jgi:endonuclease III